MYETLFLLLLDFLLQNWEKVLLINMYGCAHDPSYYFNWISSSPLNSTSKIAIHQYGNLFLPVCSHSEGSPALAVVIFISFILLCAFILMSIMIAVVTAGIRERIEEIQGTIPMNAGPVNSQDTSAPTQKLPSSSSSKPGIKHGEEKQESITRDGSEGLLSSRHSLVESFDPELVLLMLKQVLAFHTFASFT
jgi:hypothetical protein